MRTPRLLLRIGYGLLSIVCALSAAKVVSAAQVDSSVSSALPKGRFIAAAGLIPGRTSVVLDGWQTIASLERGAALLGTVGPIGVLSPDRTTILYSAVAANGSPPSAGASLGAPVDNVFGRPLVRLRDLRTGEDRIVDEGAAFPTWSNGAAIAYFKGIDPDLRGGKTFTGHVVVRRQVAAAPERWTRVPGRYQPLAWAGDRLLLNQTPPGAEAGGDLLIADGPDSARPFTDVAGGYLALSPDGTMVLVGGIRDSDGTLMLELVDIATGKPAAGSRVEAPPGARITSLGTTTWLNGSVVIGGAVGDAPALLIFDSSNGNRTLTLGRIVTLEGRGARSLPENAYFTQQQTRVVATYLVDRDHAHPSIDPHQWRIELADCTIATGACKFVPLQQPADVQLGRVYNPSRPIPLATEPSVRLRATTVSGLQEEEL
jgi:hypothetical protein